MPRVYARLDQVNSRSYHLGNLCWHSGILEAICGQTINSFRTMYASVMPPQTRKIITHYKYRPTHP